VPEGETWEYRLDADEDIDVVVYRQE